MKLSAVQKLAYLVVARDQMEKQAGALGALAQNRYVLPGVMGLMGTAAMLPGAIGQFKENDTIEGLAMLLAGAGMGTGAGIISRKLLASQIAREFQRNRMRYLSQPAVSWDPNIINADWVVESYPGRILRNG